MAGVVIVIIMVMNGSANAGNAKMANFGKSRARLVLDVKNINFSNVAGLIEEKEELEEIENALIEKDNSNAFYSNVSEKEYRTNMGYKTGKEYAKHIETLAKSQLKERLAVAAIAKANNLEVTEDYNQKEQEKLAQEFGFSTVEELNAKMVRNEIRLMIKKFYVADYLIKHSK